MPPSLVVVSTPSPQLCLGIPLPLITPLNLFLSAFLAPAISVSVSPPPCFSFLPFSFFPSLCALAPVPTTGPGMNILPWT